MEKQFGRLVTNGIGGVVILSVFSMFSCDESLHPRDLKDLLSPVLLAKETDDVRFIITSDLVDTVLTGSGAFFSVGLKNNSDEVLQAKANIHGRLEISSLMDSTFHRTFDFTVPQFDTVTINPSSQFTVSVVWDQRDDSCRYVFRNLRVDSQMSGRVTWWVTTEMLTFRVRGRVQFWPNVQTKELSEITIQRRYYFNFYPSEFMHSRNCSQYRNTP